jgi:hypothetical protein
MGWLENLPGRRCTAWPAETGLKRADNQDGAERRAGKAVIDSRTRSA